MNYTCPLTFYFGLSLHFLLTPYSNRRLTVTWGPVVAAWFSSPSRFSNPLYSISLSYLVYINDSHSLDPCACNFSLSFSHNRYVHFSTWKPSKTAPTGFRPWIPCAESKQPTVRSSSLTLTLDTEIPRPQSRIEAGQSGIYFETMLVVANNVKGPGVPPGLQRRKQNIVHTSLSPTVSCWRNVGYRTRSFLALRRPHQLRPSE